jgi:hypothetical protein
LVAGISYLVWDAARRSPSSNFVFRLKIILGQLQVNMIASRLDFSWPAPFNSILEGGSVLVGATSSFLSLNCQMRGGPSVFYATLVITLLTPLLLVFAPAGVLALIYLVKKWKMPAGQAAQSTLKDLKERYFRLWATIFAVVSFLVHPVVSTQALLLFSCKSLPSGKFLIADMSVACWSSEHTLWVVLAGGPMVT